MVWLRDSRAIYLDAHRELNPLTGGVEGVALREILQPHRGERVQLDRSMGGVEGVALREILQPHRE